MENLKLRCLQRQGLPRDLMHGSSSSSMPCSVTFSRSLSLCIAIPEFTPCTSDSLQHDSLCMRKSLTLHCHHIHRAYVPAGTACLLEGWTCYARRCAAIVQAAHG